MGNGLTRSTLYLVCALENKGKNNEFFKSAVWKENSEFFQTKTRMLRPEYL